MTNHALTHPLTGQPIIPLGWRRDGRPIFPILGAAEDDGNPAGDDTYTPPKSQEEFDTIFSRRLERERAKLESKYVQKYSDYDTLKDKASKHDAMEIDLGTTADKAAAAARTEERQKATAEYTLRVVRAEFKAAAKGVLTSDQLTAVLEDLDLSKYVTGTGDVDEEKVSKKIAALAPAKDAGSNGNGTTYQPRDLGQGNRAGVKVTAKEQGAAEAAKRFAKKS